MGAFENYGPKMLGWALKLGCGENPEHIVNWVRGWFLQMLLSKVLSFQYLKQCAMFKRFHHPTVD